jgi:hypothetical protein
MPGSVNNKYEMLAADDKTNGILAHGIPIACNGASVTWERKPFSQEPGNEKIAQPGTARANIAVDRDHPDGTTERNWASEHRHQTVCHYRAAISPALSDLG